MDAVSRLAQVPFLGHLTPPELQLLATICHSRKYIAGEDIIHQGDLTTRFFIVDEGYVHFRKTDTEGVETPEGNMGPGGYFGIKMFTSQEPSEHTVEAYGAATLYVMERTEFDNLLEANPALHKSLPEIERERHQLTGGFTWLAPGEIVAYTLRRHWYALILALRIPGVGALALGTLLVVLTFLGIARDFNAAHIVVLVLIGIALVGIVWASLDWLDDEFIVTNKRVVHYERVLLLQEARDEVPIDKIQTATVVGGGAIETALGIATLEIRTAGSVESRIVFDYIFNAEDVRKLIQQQLFILRAREAAVQRERFRRSISGELRHYILKEPEMERPPQAAPQELPTQLRPRVWSNRFQRLIGIEYREGNTITWRKHYVVLLEQMQWWLLGALFVLAFAWAYAVTPAAQKIFPATGYYAALIVAFIIAIAGAIWEFQDWRLDLYSVTEREVIDSEKRPFGLNAKTTTALLSNIQDVKANRPRFVNNLLNYGDVEVRTAGGGPAQIFKSVPRPEAIVDEIFRRSEVFRIKRQERETGIASRQIVDALVAFNRLLAESQHRPAQSLDAAQIEASLNGTQGEEPPPQPALNERPAQAQLAAPSDNGGNQLVVRPAEPRLAEPRQDESSEFPPAEDLAEEL